jgi:glyceraldehyde-3-phosphate dehydrogenase/erythrose-4-phosphate dehydrogenase
MNLAIVGYGKMGRLVEQLAAEQDLARVVGALHAEFFREPDPAVFD